MKIKAIRSIFWNGVLIPEGTVLDANKEAKQQLVDEEQTFILLPKEKRTK